MNNTIKTNDHFDFSFTKNGAVITGYNGPRDAETIYIEDTFQDTPIIGIASKVFENMKNLNIVTVPDTVAVIGENAFRGCRSLEHINIPISLREVRSGAFCRTALDVIKLPPSIRYVGAYAFADCTSLTYIYLPDTLKKLEPNAFYGCTGLAELQPHGFPVSTSFCKKGYYPDEFITDPYF